MQQALESWVSLAMISTHLIIKDRPWLSIAGRGSTYDDVSAHYSGYTPYNSRNDGTSTFCSILVAFCKQQDEGSETCFILQGMHRAALLAREHVRDFFGWH